MLDTPKLPTIAEWKRLYELAVEVRDLAPWKWMEETEVFGVENPDTGEIGFVSVMGTLGEHHAICVYIGAEALYKFWDLQDDEAYDSESLALFDIPQIQVSFEDRSELEKQDRDIIKKLGLKFKGAQGYPMFRSIKPGYLPWFITSEEARFLIHALEQVLKVAPRVKDNPLILTVEDDPKDQIYLIRVSNSENGGLVWRDEMKRIARPPAKKVPILIPPEMVDQLKAFPQNKDLTFEMDLFTLPLPIGKQGERQMLPKMLMVSDADSFFILGSEFLEPREDISEMNDAVIRTLFKIWSRHKILPGEIHVGSDLLFNLLKAFTQRLNIKVRQTDELHAIDDARNAIIDQFSHGRL